MNQIEKIIKEHPEWFKDELDKWLFREFGILGGACSSIESMKYDVTREVAEKAITYAKDIMMKDAIEVKVSNTSFIPVPSGFDIKAGDKVLIIKGK